MALPVACKFKRFKTGQVVTMNDVMGIVIAETHAPYIDRDRVICGKYHVHFPCGVECVGGEVLELGTLDTIPEDPGGDDFDARFALFFDGCKQIYNDFVDKHYPNNPRDEFNYKVNRKYIRVTMGGSAHCFVNRENGDVLKPASWGTPAKHARGNIFDDKNGLGSMIWTGPAYLRG